MYSSNIPVTTEFLIYIFQIPLSQGGMALPWDSPLIIGMLVAGVVLVGVFLVVEWKFARLPVIPCEFEQVPVQLGTVY